MTKICQNCEKNFDLAPEDLELCKRLGVPPPTWCPECRVIRRFAFRNERNLYKRKCDLCGEAKIMMYPEGTPFPVYCKPCWWSDKWDARTFGRELDLSRPFFEQFRELWRTVPRPSVIHQGNNVDSDYTNRVTDQRGSYLVFGSFDSQYCRYGVWMNNTRECLDSYNIQKSEQCYECIDCFQCSRLRYSGECTDCADSYFLQNCRNCQDCFGCVNLRNKRYCIWNEQYSKEDYERILQGYRLDNAIMLDGLRAKFEDLKKRHIVPALVTHHSERVSGNWIENSQDIHRSFSITNVEEGRHCFSVVDAKDVMDYTYWGAGSERVYDTINCGRQCADIHFANECWDQVLNAEYAMNCHNSHHLFGCIGVRGGEYCILNRPYSKEEFETLAPKLRAAMDARKYVDGQGRAYGYGEFFPFEFAPSAYNETIAQEFFPLARAEALARGLAWREDSERDYKISLPAGKVPDDLDGVTAAIAQEIIGCGHAGTCNHRCTTAFRILAEDLEFYRKHRLPLPKLCPNCRHFERLARRTPLKLWPRQCRCGGKESNIENGDGSGARYRNTAEHFHGAAPCPNMFETAYAPGRPDTVYCLDCYQAEVA